MKNFKELDKRDVSTVNQSIIDSWGSVTEICNRTIENRNGCPKFVFMMDQLQQTATQAYTICLQSF